MTTVSLYLAVTFAAALLAIRLRLPPLVGFLAAGFVLQALSAPDLPWLDTVADLGVTLLLFGIGLKLDLRTLARREVWLTSCVHLGGSVLAGTALLALLNLLGFTLVAGAGWGGVALIALALSFSSTVLAVKVLSDRSETQSHYGRVAIGVLVVQDIVAVAFLTWAGGEVPSPWALALVLLVPGAWLVRRIWDLVPHGEMQVLFGIVVALVPGYALFEAVGLKGDLGALVVGALLAPHAAAGELSKNLLTVKELLLVGFFVSIGLGSAPTGQTLLLALLLLVLLPLKTFGFFAALTALGLGHRTATLTGLTLGTYSEFALIVAAVGVDQGLLDPAWLVVLSLAVAASFVIASLVDRVETRLVPWWTRRLPAQDPARLHPEDRPIDLSEAHAVVLGMGRIGRAAYLQLERRYGQRVVGIETDVAKLEALAAEGLHVQEADATDVAFWQRVNVAGHVGLVVLAMPFHGSNLEALRLLRASAFTGRVAAVVQYDDQARQLRAEGVDTVLQIYSGVGTQLADEAMEAGPPG